MAWLCQQLRSKNKQIAYREVRAVLMGDYYDGQSASQSGTPTQRAPVPCLLLEPLALVHG